MAADASSLASFHISEKFFCETLDSVSCFLYIAFHDALVAQLDRATGYEPVGQEFESLRAHHNKNKRLAVTGCPLVLSPSVCSPVPEDLFNASVMLLAHVSVNI